MNIRDLGLNYNVCMWVHEFIIYTVKRQQTFRQNVLNTLSDFCFCHPIAISSNVLNGLKLWVYFISYGTLLKMRGLRKLTDLIYGLLVVFFWLTK